MNPFRDRTSIEQGRIIICGTGRAGTTFLVQLFTALGFGTGFSLEDSFNLVDEISHAGLERDLVDDANPYVIKSPCFSDQLDWALKTKSIKINAAVVPMRNLFNAAASRRRVYREAYNRGLDPVAQRGSLWHTEKPEKQEEVLALQFYKTILPLVEFEVPIYFAEFPRFVRDPDYLFRTLQLLMTIHDVDRSEFLKAHACTARPVLISDFEEPLG